jgi:hypothetical protein
MNGGSNDGDDGGSSNGGSDDGDDGSSNGGSGDDGGDIWLTPVKLSQP